MGAALGMMLGLGLALIWWAVAEPHSAFASHRKTEPPDRTRSLLIAAGLPETSPSAVWSSSLVIWLMVMLLVYLLTKTASISLIIASGAASLPWYLLQSRAKKRKKQLAQLWPDVIDDIVAGIRAGMSLPEILIQLGESGPEQLRADFTVFAAEFRANGRMSTALDALKWRLNNPDATRLIEVLRLSREVGGTDLGSLLRELSAMIRADLRTRGEIEARQSWTTNAARLAVVSPWIVLVMISTRTNAAEAYATTQGTMVLLSGLLVSGIAYWLMLKLGRLSERGDHA
ncbi:type II secretion system F family protein [Boudabousia marimammalium]|uniref:Type II secretion system protein GspF domain-containing protein n=1 Tax=Boudabousia marimammalium TaxID=156892 RepID=A0A1Q5PM03_9ACTO|nr:type II secretion system F family protein [Boudabousia marimammalium]OKL48095.1 hypothetical protein BM477_06450 [Boudabousia marimammalium]